MPAGSVSNARAAAALRPATSTMSMDGAPRANEMSCSAVMRPGYGSRRAGLPPPVRNVHHSGTRSSGVRARGLHGLWCCADGADARELAAGALREAHLPAAPPGVEHVRYLRS